MPYPKRSINKLNTSLAMIIGVLIIVVLAAWALPFLYNPPTTNPSNKSIPLGTEKISQPGNIQGQNQYSPQNALPITRGQLDQLPLRQP